MDMSLYNFAPNIALLDEADPVDGALLTLVTETALNLGNLERAIETYLGPNATILDAGSRAHLARTRDALLMHGRMAICRRPNALAPVALYGRDWRVQPCRCRQTPRSKRNTPAKSWYGRQNDT